MGQDSRVGRKPEVTDDDIVEVVASFDDPVATTSEIADQLPISRRRVHDRLKALLDDDRVRAKDVGSRSRVWWVEGRTGRPESGGERRRESAERAPASDRDREVVEDVERVQESEGGDESGRDVDGEAIVDDLDVRFDALDLPGSGAKLDERREAVRAAVVYLVENGVATRSDFQRDVYPDHRARYTSGDDPAYSWWKNTIIDGLKQVAEQTDAVEEPDYTGDWRYVGDDVDE